MELDDLLGPFQHKILYKSVTAFLCCLFVFLLFLFLGKLTDCTERGHAKTVTNSFQGALLHGIGLYPSRKHTDMEKPRQVVIRAS